ncbi:hypothetical protein [Diplocloster modestus]|nr:hypothetical protein [Diplocloster modestus]
MDQENKHFWQRIARLYAPFMKKSGANLYKEICGEIRPQRPQTA